MAVAERVHVTTRARVFVCVRGLVYQTFLDELTRRVGTVDYQLTSTGCLGPCASGATVFTHPDGTLYGRVTPADVPEIVLQHLIGGTPVARLVVQD